MGLCNGVAAYPDNYASYPVSVRQFRRLPFGLLQCMGRPKPPCHLLMLQGVTLAHKGLSPSGLSSKFNYSKNLIIFTIQGAHSGFKKLAVQWLQEVQFSNVTFVVADSFVLRNRQLLKPAQR